MFVIFIIILKKYVYKGGDSDSTATIACAWYGTLYGLDNVPKNCYD